MLSRVIAIDGGVLAAVEVPSLFSTLVEAVPEISSPSSCLSRGLAMQLVTPDPESLGTSGVGRYRLEWE